MPQFRRQSFQNFAIENLTIYLIVLSAAVTGYGLITGNILGVVSLQGILSGEWWHIFFYPFRIAEGPLMLLLFCYVFWLFGSSLEQAIGSARYTRYLFTGILLITIGAILFPGSVPASFLYLSVFLAVAYLQPNMEILLFFILPVKMKWIAFVTVALALSSTMLQLMSGVPIYYVLSLFFAFGNFLIFFGIPFLKDTKKQQVYKERRERLQPISRTAIHRCTACGRTEHDDPNLDFRFCVDCDDHEYCSDHLYSHDHIRSQN